MSLKQNIRITETYKGASVPFKKFTSLELIQKMIKRVVWLQTPNSILARWMNHFSQLLNVHGFGDVRPLRLRQLLKRKKRFKSLNID
jgi:hypothetical protein